MDFDFSKQPVIPRTEQGMVNMIMKLWTYGALMKDKYAQTQNPANSSNSSMPPSSDSLKIKAEKKKENEDWRKRTAEYWRKRKQGGQPGHKGFGRALINTNEVDKVIEIIPDKICKKCSTPTNGRQVRRRKQVIDIIHGSVFITEYQLLGGQCYKCNKRYCGKLPDEVPKGLFSDEVLAKVSLLTGKYHLSKSEVKGLLKDFFKLDISTGSISNAEHKVSQALKPCVDELEDKVKEQAIIHADETSHFNKGSLCWLWVATNTMLTLFKINPNRNKEAAVALLGGSFSGVLVSDRYGSYNFVPNDKRQYCWAHLKRDFVRLTEHRDSQVASLGFKLHSCLKSIFTIYRKIKDKVDNLWAHKTLRDRIAIFYRVLRKGKCIEDKKAKRLCKTLTKKRCSLWLFCHDKKIAPTNNHAERQIRHAVIWRKKCFGTQSQRGMFYVERILSVIKTCHQQQKDCFDFIKQSLLNKRTNKPYLGLFKTDL